MTDPLLPAAAALPLAFVFGALIGSFLNVVVWRVPQGLSIVRPPSACPSCGHEIAWYDNIPIVSWLVLRAKCRACGAHISVRYPLVEAGTGAPSPSSSVPPTSACTPSPCCPPFCTGRPSASP
jgi:leader peptidase (prepilin peptidase)/N-methyltransferase